MPDKPTFTVDLQPTGRRTEVRPGRTLLQAAQSAGIELQSVCGGNGTCRHCQIRVVAGTYSEPTAAERMQLGEQALNYGLRLACQAIPRSNATVEIPADSLTCAQRVLVESEEVRIKVDRYGPGGCSPHGGMAVGFAVDLGTTKIAGYLVDLKTGATLAQHGLMNPQMAYGEDVISRISFASRASANRHRLQEIIIDSLNKLAVELGRQADISTHQIMEVVVAGNTAMHHLFAGLPVQQLGVAPYLPASTEAAIIPAAQLGLALGTSAVLYTPPNIAGYVGGDHVAMLLGIDIDNGKQPALAIDIGTNTELTLKVNDRLLTCSCASGPAFEGGHIRQGMRAAPGAIERVSFHNGAIQVYTIDRHPACGICGSGILDAIAALREAEFLDVRGNFQKSAPGFRRTSRGSEFVLVNRSETARSSEIVLTRQDVCEIQLAKAAIRAGIEVLLKTAELETNDLNRFVLAGAFGSYLDPRSAMRIGLFPEIQRERITQVGNAAGLGARQMLCSLAKRREAEYVARHIEYIELTNHLRFHEQFVNALSF